MVQAGDDMRRFKVDVVVGEGDVITSFSLDRTPQANYTIPVPSSGGEHNEQQLCIATKQHHQQQQQQQRQQRHLRCMAAALKADTLRANRHVASVWVVLDLLALLLQQQQTCSAVCPRYLTHGHRCNV
jgi:hypothetical protein